MMADQSLVDKDAGPTAPDSVPVACFLVDDSGLTTCTSPAAVQQRLGEALTATDHEHLLAFAAHLAYGRNDCGLLPLGYRSLLGKTSSANWTEEGRHIDLYLVRLDDSPEGFLGQFIGEFAQSLRQPATKLGIFANLLTHGECRNSDFYEQVFRGEIARLKRVIENLSLISQSMRPAAVSYEPISLGQLASVIQNSLEPFQENGRWRVKVAAGDPSAPKALVNRKLIGVAVRNLVHHMPRSDPTGCEAIIRVRSVPSWTGITIECPGFAISADSLLQLFGPYVQESLELELPLVRFIIDNHHGHITAACSNLPSITLWLPSPTEWDMQPGWPLDQSCEVLVATTGAEDNN
jgi:signal transduction histidine kinase